MQLTSSQFQCFVTISGSGESMVMEKRSFAFVNEKVNR